MLMSHSLRNFSSPRSSRHGHHRRRRRRAPTTGRSGGVRAATGCRPKPGCSSSGRRADRRWRGRLAGAGEGYSSFAVSAGRLFTLGARQGTEYVLAFDAASGKRLWEVANGRRFENDRGSGPRSTPTVDGDRVYVFGSSGDLTVLDAATGKVFWTQNLLRSTAAPTSSGASANRRWC